MSNLKLGIIGAGYIAEKHLEVISKIRRLKVVGITSRTFSKAKKLANKFGIKNIYLDYVSLFNNNKLDGILILVSPEEIYPVLNQIIPYRIPFFVEKPPGLSFFEIQKICKKVNKFKLKNMVGYNRRYYSNFKKGIKLINNKGGLLGLIVEGHERFWKITDKVSNVNRENWLYSNSSHTIDLLRFFGGEIQNYSINKFSFIENKGDQFSLSIKFKNNIVGTYIANWYSPGGWSVKLFGKGVTVKFEPLERGFWYDKNMNIHEITLDQKDLIYKPGFYFQMIEFRNFLDSGVLSWPGQDLQNIMNTFSIIKKIVDAK